ncbi:MAG: hypothetical protein ACRDHM_07405 [Actinomycetota bacterium]
MTNSARYLEFSVAFPPSGWAALVLTAVDHLAEKLGGQSSWRQEAGRIFVEVRAAPYTLDRVRAALSRIAREPLLDPTSPGEREVLRMEEVS